MDTDPKGLILCRCISHERSLVLIHDSRMKWGKGLQAMKLTGSMYEISIIMAHVEDMYT